MIFLVLIYVFLELDDFLDDDGEGDSEYEDVSDHDD